jgi:hypothetical protein
VTVTHDPLLLAIIGHLVGDYILQNDLLALNKKNPRPGSHPEFEGDVVKDMNRIDNWIGVSLDCWGGRIACFVHCIIWTLCVCVFAGWNNPWSIAFLFVTHFIQDRTNIILWWMKIMGQEKFAAGPCSPWSIIVVDNVWHVLEIYVVARWFP